MNKEEQRIYDRFEEAGACKLQLRSMERDFDFFRTFEAVKKYTIVILTIAIILFTALSWLGIFLFGVDLVHAFIPTLFFSGWYIYWMMKLDYLSNEVTRDLMDEKYPELREWDKD